MKHSGGHAFCAHAVSEGYYAWAQKRAHPTRLSWWRTVWHFNALRTYGQVNSGFQDKMAASLQNYPLFGGNKSTLAPWPLFSFFSFLFCFSGYTKATKGADRSQRPSMDQ